MNRKLIVSILAIILVVSMIFSLLLAVVPMSRADGLSNSQHTSECSAELYSPKL